MRCNLMDSGLGWKHWGDAYRVGMFAKNRVPRENGQLSRHEKFYGYAPSYKRMIPFGALGFIEDKTDKESLTRAKCGKMIGYPDDTDGWLFLKDGGRIEATRHARFDTRNYMQRNQAIGEESPVDQGFEETHGTVGMPIGGTDSEIRAKIKSYNSDIITSSVPTAFEPRSLRPRTTGARSEKLDPLTDVVKSVIDDYDRPTIVFTKLEAEGTIENGRANDCLITWDKKHTKSGKSGARYEVYKHYTTFKEIDTAVLNKTMKKTDLRYDIQHGHCQITKQTPVPQNEIEAIEINFAGLVDEIEPVNKDIGPIERLYHLRSKIRRKTGDHDIQEDDWNTKLISAVHMGCVMGWDDKGTKRAMKHFALATINEIVCGKTTPLSYREAKSLPEWEAWKESMEKEFRALQDMGVFELVKRTDLPKKSRVVKTKWIYKIKQNSDGTISKYKSRLVAQGFLLRWGIDYYDTYSSVVGYNTLRTILNISAITGEKISQADIGNAYVESSPDSDTVVHTTQCPGMEEMDPKEYVYRMKKSLYGIPFSGRTFQRVMEEFMISLGFKRCMSDKCVYIKWVNGERIIVLTYVDDLISMTNSASLRTWWKDSLRKRFQKVTFNDECEWILNMKLTRGVNSDGKAWVGLSQELAITKIAQAAGLTEARRATTPTVADEKLYRTVEGDKPPSENWSYPSILGGVLYVANLTRPDIAYAAHRLTRYLKNPNHTHCQALKRLVRYLYTTKEIGIRYTGGGRNPFRLNAAADASFADCEDTRRSTLGWCQWLGSGEPSGLITWGSRIGKNVALSTTESEVQAALELLKDTLWMRDFLREVGYRQTGSTRILEDNNGCLGQATATTGLRRARHYLTALAALNEATQAGDVHLHRVDSDENTADAFTKGLGSAKNTKFATQTTGHDMSHLYRSRDAAAERKEGERTPTSTVTKEGESATPQMNVDDDNTLHPCSKDGEQMANLVLIGEDMGSPSSTDGLKVTMKYTGGRGIKVDNYTDIEYQTVPMSRDAYLRIALAHAEAGNESKFNMFFKAAKLIGHVQNLKEKYPASVCK